MSEKDMKIYLAGYISGEVIDQCFSWRKRLREHYNNWPDKNGKPKRYPICWLDPLNGEDFAEISPDGLKGVLPANAIVHKDYRSVEICDLIVVNMDTFGQKRPLIGTICELAWAWDKHKPIIMVTDDYNYREHPFFKSFVSWFIPTVDELIEKKLINEFYKAWHSAQY
jgi:hypothetical protein